MKFSKKYIAAGSAVIVSLSLCAYALNQHRSQENKDNNRVSYVDGSQSSQKTENLTPDQVSQKEGIQAEQIVIKITDQGYVTSHGDHYHYYNGKVPYDALFSEELLMKDPNYQLKDADIVNEVKGGYIIKVDGKYYVYLKDAAHADNVRTKDEINRQKQEHVKDNEKVSSDIAVARSQGRYTTDDGYVFNPADIIEDTGDAYIVPHGGHYHYIPKSDLSASELAAAKGHLAGKNTQPSQLSYSSTASDNNTQSVAQGSTSKSESKVENLQSLLKELYDSPSDQRYSESDGLVFDPAKIISRTPNGVVIPHGDHYHFIPYSKLSALEEKIARMVPIGGTGSTVSTNAKPHEVASSPSTLNHASLLTNKPISSTSDGYIFNPKDIVEETATAYIVRHGDHFHYIPKANQIGQPTLPNNGLVAPSPSLPINPGSSHEEHEEGGHGFDANRIIAEDAAGFVMTHGNHNHYFFKKDLSAEQIKAAQDHLKGANTAHDDDHDGDEHDHHHGEDHDHGFDADRVISEDEQGFVMSHGDHNHYFFKKDLTANQIKEAQDHLKTHHDAEPVQPLAKSVESFSKDASDEEKIAYISKTYGVPLEAIRISNGFFVFGNPDQAYDPTHIHPYAVRKEHVRLPLQTGNPELDFLNELYTTALRDGVSPYSLQVENGSFVIPHGDHNHYIKVQTKGYEVALKNKIPALQSNYQPGAFDEKTVLAKVEQLLADSRNIYKDKPIEQRQIELALGQFTENMKKLATNSTAGYLKTLDLFDKQYIHIDESVKPVETSALDKKYQALIDKINTLDTDSYGLPKKDLLVRLQEAKLAKDEAALVAVESQLQALQDFNDRTGDTTVEYIKYFYENVNDSRLNEDLRNKVANLTFTLYQSQSFRKAVDLNKLFPSIYQTKQEVEEALKNQPATAKVNETVLDKEKVDNQSAKQAIYEFLKDLYPDLKKEEHVNHVSKEEVESLLNKATQLLEQIQEEGIRQSLAEEVENLKAATNKADADLDEVNSQVKDVLTRIASALQQEKENAEQDPQTLVLYQKLYDILISLHSYLESNNGSDADFDKVDALLDQLSAKSKDKAALLELTKAILVLNHQIQSKASASEETSPARNAEANGDNTSAENQPNATAESNSETASDENKPSNTRDSKPAESTSEKETAESTTSAGNQEKPAQ
ncbi:pneumococcal histidine triad protein E [Streptococcus pneumoniae]|uniref:pneumococcal-type histidine triad protein n=1 Tax=Streptococcus pneumoniae TaxID=1313 RepID=UPI0005DBC99F|nr:pneumococcal-type histidine triad protein [Streptococcus pneumoniae]CKI71850.1 pneumococcal histidine triad protein E [Streptococcus pneumoniae]VIU80006.1 pneumococcal histidine triad protein E [Streptococcus pneumoniae]VIY96110.1 pneumococcal histidine triad protein E [Streptococcus pneumoniae]VIZ07014.1 pneumococcal histidine triad protein E [Streptococcus pneumoniae]VIZ74368.1 pneumococcal histidine triad protein E [Streptococcus pneumoniae]